MESSWQYRSESPKILSIVCMDIEPIKPIKPIKPIIKNHITHAKYRKEKY